MAAIVWIYIHAICGSQCPGVTVRCPCSRFPQGEVGLPSYAGGPHVSPCAPWRWAKMRVEIEVTEFMAKMRVEIEMMEFMAKMRVEYA